MSRRGKNVTSAAKGDVERPAEGQHIVKALQPRGSNVFEVEHPDNRKTLVLLPSRFQKKLWVKHGGYLIIEEAEGAEVDGCKITGTIVAVLYPEHIKQLKKEPGVWPAQFDDVSTEDEPDSRDGNWEVRDKGADTGADSDSDDDRPPLEQTHNRKVIYYSESEEDSD